MKKYSNHIVQLSKAFVALLLFGIVLLSSCTLRKPIQQFLDLSVAKQLNVGKTTYNSATSCSIDYENAATSKQLKTKNKFVLDTSFPFAKQLIQYNFTNNEVTPSFRSASGWPTIYKVPVYILFKKLRLHL